jgi:cell volume regulation protein A
MHEPLATALLLAAAGVLLAAGVLVSRTSGRLGVPAALIFLAVGMAAGSHGLGGIRFEDYGLAFRLGTVALVMIVFDGGLNTPIPSLRGVLAPSAMLATVGVVGTATLAALAAVLLGLPWPQAMIFGAVVSSTDAAAVYAVLRGGGITLRGRVGRLLELESGLNDPMAVILTLALTATAVSGGQLGWRLALDVLLQLGVGAVGGLAIGWVGRLVMVRARLSAAGLYPVLSLALAMLSFGVPSLLWGSGFLAVYVTAMMLGAGQIPYLPGLRRVHDAIAWFSQVGMFLLLGLLAVPGRILSQAWTFPFGFTFREVLLVAWVGLRGAVPIILACYVVLAKAPGAAGIFDLVFFVVLVSTAAQGGTARWLARRLDLVEATPPAPRAVLELVSTQPLSGEMMVFHVEPASAVAGARISDLPLPPDAAVMLVLRGKQLVPARGRTVLTPDDHVYVTASPGDAALVRLLFGQAEEA